MNKEKSSYLEPDPDPELVLPDVDNSPVHDGVVRVSVLPDQDEENLHPVGVNVVLEAEVLILPLDNPATSVLVLKVGPVRFNPFL
mgnify:FL=1